MYEPRQICLALIHAPVKVVSDGIHAELVKTVKSASVALEFTTIDWSKFFEGDGLLYDMKRYQIALFAPHSDLTVYVCNLADGWVSLFGNFASASACDAYFFRATLRGSEKFEIYEMTEWRRGTISRRVRALQDDNGWKFLNEGAPSTFENLPQYKKQKVKDRLDRASILKYSEAAGYRVDGVLTYHGQSRHFSCAEHPSTRA